MVKFGKYLIAHRVTEWQSQYVRYKQLKKLLKQVASEESATADGHSSSTVNNARQVALSSRQWARTARLRVEEEEKHAPVFATYMQESLAHEQPTNKPPAPTVLHHTDRFHSIGSAVPLHPPPEPKPHPAASSSASSPSLPPTASSNPPPLPSDHSHVFTTLFATRLQRPSAEWRFFETLDEDLVTVNTFFLRQEEFFLSKAEVLSDQLTSLLSRPNITASASASLLHPLAGRKGQSDLPMHAQHVLERALKELYRGLQLLRNYKIMNYTASVNTTANHSQHCSFTRRISRCWLVCTRHH